MTEKVKRKLNSAASKMLAMITGQNHPERSPKSYYKRSDEGARQKMELAGTRLRMPEHRLVRQVQLNCDKPTHETLSQTYQT